MRASRQKASQTNRVGGKATDLNIPLILRHTGIVHVALHMVRIHRVGREADRSFRDLPTLTMILIHDLGSDHATGFTNV